MKNSVESSIFLNECSPDEISEIMKDLLLNKASDIPIKALKRTGGLHENFEKSTFWCFL